MFGKLMRKAIERTARSSGQDPAYTLAFYDASPKSLMAVGRFAGLLKHRECVSAEAHFAAQITGALQEGCGSCVQIHIDMARSEGVADALIETIVTGEVERLPPDPSLAVRFARAIGTHSDDEMAAREAVRQRWGDKGVADLAMATQVSRFLSMIKAGMGHATACGPLSVGERRISPPIT